MQKESFAEMLWEYKPPLCQSPIRLSDRKIPSEICPKVSQSCHMLQFAWNVILTRKRKPVDPSTWKVKNLPPINARCRWQKKNSNKHTDLQNTISFKIEMLQRDVQTWSSRCLSPGQNILLSLLRVCPHPNLPRRWRDVQIKGPVTAPCTRRIPYHRGVRLNCRAKGSV